MKREPAEPQGFIKPTGVGIPRLQAGEEVNGNIAKARGMAQVAKDAGVGRESLYKSLSENGNPSFSTIMKVVHSLGGRITIEPIAL